MFVTSDSRRPAGIGRRTFFRYFASKNDLVWGDFEGHPLQSRKLLDESDPGIPMMHVLRRAVVEFNRFDPQEVPWHRQRMELILRVPTLQADATLRYASWRMVVAEFVAARIELTPSAMVPRLTGHILLGATAVLVGDEDGRGGRSAQRRGREDRGCRHPGDVVSGVVKGKEASVHADLGARLS